MESAEALYRPVTCRCRLGRSNALDDCFLARTLAIAGRGRQLAFLFCRGLDHPVRGLLQFVLREFVMAQAQNAVLRGFQMDVRDQQDTRLVAQFDGAVEVGVLGDDPCIGRHSDFLSSFRSYVVYPKSRYTIKKKPRDLWGFVGLCHSSSSDVQS